MRDVLSVRGRADGTRLVCMTGQACPAQPKGGREGGVMGGRVGQVDGRRRVRMTGQACSAQPKRCREGQEQGDKVLRG